MKITTTISPLVITGDAIGHMMIMVLIDADITDDNEIIDCFPTVTLARALELGHKPSVVSSLAVETSQIFKLAGQ